VRNTATRERSPRGSAAPRWTWISAGFTSAAGLYPDILPARAGHPHSLTIDNAPAGHGTLKAALIWWPLGMVLAAVYFVYAYRMFFRGNPAPQLGGDEPGAARAS